MIVMKYSNLQQSKKGLSSKKTFFVLFVLIGVFLIGRFTGPGAVLEDPYKSNDRFVSDEMLVEQNSPQNDHFVPGEQAPTEQDKLTDATTTDNGPTAISPAKQGDSGHINIAEKIFLKVPFTSQAPFADWEDPRQQDGCEEASVLMAMHWMNGEALTRQSALEEIIAVSEYELDKYGSYKDTSAADTFERIIRGYYGFDKGEVVYGIIKNDIISALIEGKLVIVPADGRVLANPNYTAPGPEHHMLVIKGYDPATNEFVTNDPGTRMGESFRYDEEVMYEAIRDYPTSGSASDRSGDKVMIVMVKN